MKTTRAVGMVVVGAMLGLAFTYPTHAALLTWHLEDVVFDDGGTGSGFYGWDADTETFGSDYDIKLSASAHPQTATNVLFDGVELTQANGRIAGRTANQQGVITGGAD